MTVEWIDAGPYLAGVALVLVTYLPFSPATIDLIFYSRARQLAIFKRRHRLWAVSGVLFAVLLGTSLWEEETLWLWVLGGTAVGLGGAFWIGYVPWVMSPPTDRRVVSADEADELLDPDDAVIGVEYGGETRAYPRKHLARPHYMPDVVGDDLLVVTYCVLCNSAVALDGTLDGRPMDLVPITAPDNNIMLLDRNSDNVIQQLEAEVVDGPDEGRRLETVPVEITDWAEWRTLHPETTVMYAPPQSLRDRVVDSLLDLMVAIPKLEARDEPFHRIKNGIDDRLPAMSYVLGIEQDDEAIAIPTSVLDCHPVVNETVEGTPLTVFYDADREVGRVFCRRVGDRALTFEPGSGGPDAAVARDDETGSYWDISGTAIDGELEGTTLERYPHWDDLFWFSWAAFHPETRIVASPP